MSNTTLAIEPGALILITGATGSVGGAVANEVLRAGYKVRAPVRDQVKAGHLKEAFHAKYGQDMFETVIVEDLTNAEKMCEVMNDCVGIIHTASITSLSHDPNEVITPAKAMAESLMLAASKTPTIKRFVFTSSTSTLPPLTGPHKCGHHPLDPYAAQAPDGGVKDIGPECWANGGIALKGWAEPYEAQNAGAVYATSKIMSERAVWNFVDHGLYGREGKKREFAVNSVVCSTMLGGFVHRELKSSINGLVWKCWMGDEQARKMLPLILGGTNGEGSLLLSLEDAGSLHLAALTHEDVKEERILAVGERIDAEDVLGLLEKSKGGSDGKEVEAAEKVRVEMAKVKTSRMMELLGRLGKTEPMGLEESLKQLVSTD